MKHNWIYPSKSDMETERQQCIDEGRDLSSVEDEFACVLSLDLEAAANWPAAWALMDKTMHLPMRADYAYHEPSDLEGIKAARPTNQTNLPSPSLTDAELEDKVYGAWTGRVIGCLLGKPTEGWQSSKMWGYLKDLNRWPLADFFRLDVATPEVTEKYGLDKEFGADSFADRITAMPEDDDTNYTTIGMAILKRHGSKFTPEEVANFWLGEVPILHTCTAERAAYRNFTMLIPPPDSATYRNPFREWIGAQIRADFWGYANPGNPERAAEFAWRDASISHVKNGIYGEMWVAAMLAAAFVTNDIRAIMEVGLGQIPERCRLTEDIRRVIGWRESGLSYDEAVEKLHTQWNEKLGHHWCHTNSNAMIVAIGLLWGEGDYGRTICRAVQLCFDTDCNGATAGSIIGLVTGRKALPYRWVDLIHDTLHTGVAGYHTVKLADITQVTLKLIEKVTKGE